MLKKLFEKQNNNSISDYNYNNYLKSQKVLSNANETSEFG